MRIFISWSGGESRQVAAALRDWIKKVLQTVEPWMSDKDIASGARWSHAIAANLRDAKVGIICLTPENVSAPWLHFEAGALSRTVDDAFVCPLLFRIEASELLGPMAQFQAQRYGHDGVLRILQTVRNHPEHKRTLEDADFIDTFETWWPRLDEQIQLVLGAKKAETPTRSTDEMIAETLELVRTLSRESPFNRTLALSPRMDDLIATLPNTREISSLNPKLKAMPISDLVQMLVQWDSTLPNLLGGARQLEMVVDAIRSNQIGQATIKVMSAIGYKLPEARAFVDSLTIAISRLVT